MKNIKFTVILILFAAVCYFIFDRQLYYYGKNNFKIYNSLPLEIKPEFRYDFDGGFVLREKYGFALSGEGVSVGEIGDTLFEDKIIKKIIKYGFDNESLVAFIKDASGEKYYVEYLKKNNSEHKDGIRIKVRENLENLDFKVNKWVEIENNNRIRLFELFRNYSLIISIILFLIMTYQLFRRNFQTSK